MKPNDLREQERVIVPGLRFSMNSAADSSKQAAWPELPLAAWQETYATLHMWTQVVGKVRLVLTPLVNHWWEVPFYVTSRGLSTSPIPYEHGNFEMEFDFIEHLLRIETSNGATETLELEPRTVANFYREVMETVRGMGIAVDIWDMPVEVPNPVRFN